MFEVHPDNKGQWILYKFEEGSLVVIAFLTNQEDAELARKLFEKNESKLFPKKDEDEDKSNYSFCVWPDETWGFDKSVFDLFRMFNHRIEMTFTLDEFNRFRSGLSHHGLTLREIERVPCAEPENIL